MADIGPVQVYRNISLGTAGSVIKSSSATLYGVIFYNTTGTIYYKLYDLATAPTSSNIVKMTFGVDASMQFNEWFPNGIPMTNGLSIRATKNLADNDNSAPAANTAVAHIFYA